MNKTIAIVEIGSNNTKTHIYKNKKLIMENNTTIEFKKNYKINKEIDKKDLEKLYLLIKLIKTYTDNIYLFGCSIFRNLKSKELAKINNELEERFNLKIEVVSQEDEAKYTALGCYNNLPYSKNICIFIGGGGSIELIFVKAGEIISQKYYEFGVVDITEKFPSLKEDIPTCTFNEVYEYISTLINDINLKADILILAGGDHLYWYNNAHYKLLPNTLYKKGNQKYMIPIKMSDEYDKDVIINFIENKSKVLRRIEKFNILYTNNIQLIEELYK